jgi:hypothetical protein
VQLHFAPKAPLAWIEQLYRRDALGIEDTQLLDKVGARLYARCRDVLLVSESTVVCPDCGAQVLVPWIGMPSAHVSACAGCGWTITAGDFHASFEHQDLLGLNARTAFTEFVAAYPRARGYRERMLLVDRLVHAVHTSGNWAARNLIEGRASAVLARLDTLST